MFCQVFFGIQQRLCRVLDKKAPGKVLVVVALVTEWTLSYVAVGKPFAKCKRGFVVCPWHTKNNMSLVVVGDRW